VKVLPSGEFWGLGTTFENNISIGNGGAVAGAPDSFIRIQTSTFKGNEALNGGAVFSDGNIEIEGSRFWNNRAVQLGGAIWVGSVSSAKITDSVVGGNHAGEGGPAVFSNATLPVEHLVFDGNSACENHIDNSTQEPCDGIEWNKTSCFVFEKTCVVPTPFPSSTPSKMPSLPPSFTSQPSSRPSQAPTAKPSLSSKPSEAPSAVPSLPPSKSHEPSVSTSPSVSPSVPPTGIPSTSSSPSVEPFIFPSMLPSKQPSPRPSRAPTVYPSLRPTKTQSPIPLPSSVPTETLPAPTILPSARPITLEEFINSWSSSESPSSTPLPP